MINLNKRPSSESNNRIVCVPIPTGQIARHCLDLVLTRPSTLSRNNHPCFLHLPGVWGREEGGCGERGRITQPLPVLLVSRLRLGLRPRGKWKTSSSSIDSQSVGSWPVLCLSDELHRLKVRGRCFAEYRSTAIIHMVFSETRLALTSTRPGKRKKLHLPA